MKLSTLIYRGLKVPNVVEDRSIYFQPLDLDGGKKKCYACAVGIALLGAAGSIEKAAKLMQGKPPSSSIHALVAKLSNTPLEIVDLLDKDHMNKLGSARQLAAELRKKHL